MRGEQYATRGEQYANAVQQYAMRGELYAGAGASVSHASCAHTATTCSRERAASGAWSAAALEAVLCELPELYDDALRALDEASVRDGDFVSLARAAYQLAGLIEYGAARAVQQAMFDPLLQRVYTRACLHLLPAADCGDDEARQVGEGMQLLHELAHKLPYLETALWLENLR